ncbi:MAG: THUMP domain-containing protein [Pseudobdellovibrionaceae bacterium]|nr:THUMP domain-containing protein [Pseudobdellovibrionaceae bacterium]
MPVFYAPAPKGLQDVLFSEFQQLGLKKLKKVASGVTFEGPWKDCYRANLASRVANRILKPLLEFHAYQFDEFYTHIQRHDFTKYIHSDQTLRVDASVTNSILKDQRMVALKAKDAIVDQFREQVQKRPSVDKTNPDLNIIIYGAKNTFYVYLNTSGDPLYQRGYRAEGLEAPLKETLAAGLIYLSGWDKKSSLIDPFGGSGTIAIEAALMLKNMAPGSLRKTFAFQKLKNYDPQAFEQVLSELINQELPDPNEKLIFYYDRNPKATEQAKKNAKRAGVDHLIHFRTQDVTQLLPPTQQNGVIITNPPYGSRMGTSEELVTLMKDLSYVLKHHFQNWNLWLLSGNPTLSNHLGLKAEKKYPVFNGALECRFLKYPIKKGSYVTRVFHRDPEGVAAKLGQMSSDKKP